MKVNIIMPAYNGHETIRQAISSVASQDGLEEILLTIVDDCSDEPYDYLLTDYHYMNIEILRKPTNTGCGQSRQYGIDHCKCEYFMFLDVDDCIYSPCVVKQLYTIMDNEKLDSLYTNFVEELPNGRYLLHKNGGGWMHGKMFRTKYIQDNNIRYNETRLHEDHAFNIIQQYSGGKNMTVDSISYLWKRYPKSLTRTPEIRNNYDYNMEHYMENAVYTISELCRRGVNGDKIKEIIRLYVVSFYRHFNIMVSKGASQDSLTWFCGKSMDFWNSIPDNLREGVNEGYLTVDFYQSEAMKELADRNIVPTITFHQFYEMLNQ